MGKVFSGSAFLAVCGIAAAFLAVSAPLPAMAQAVDQQALTECLIANTTDEHLAAMKRLMIAALNDDTEALKNEVGSYGMIIVTMAMTKCGVTEAQLQDPAVNAAVGAYGQRLGEKIMTDAFAKIGQ
jgi:hypothetical protein